MPGGAEAIARRARGTPRIANRLLRRVRDYAQVKVDGIVTARGGRPRARPEGVDEAGLDRLDRRFLTAIIESYKGGPVGLEAIAATINDEAETLARSGRALPAQDRLRRAQSHRPTRHPRRLRAPGPRAAGLPGRAGAATALIGPFR